MPPFTGRVATSEEAAQRRAVLSIDVGTTTIRALLVDHESTILSISSRPVELETPERNVAEICPEKLWRTVLIVIHEAIASK